ncbi:MAG: hypothetical protein Q9M76_06775, partial [Candidatus Dojkabacteria bacterium]|nr:hypothetical protein [Candidatus Dojkabacteria bacterium]
LINFDKESNIKNATETEVNLENYSTDNVNVEENSDENYNLPSDEKMYPYTRNGTFESDHIIYFSNDGELKLFYEYSNEDTQLTNTGGKIAEYIISPDGNEVIFTTYKEEVLSNVDISSIQYHLKPPIDKVYKLDLITKEQSLIYSIPDYTYNYTGDINTFQEYLDANKFDIVNEINSNNFRLLSDDLNPDKFFFYNNDNIFQLNIEENSIKEIVLDAGMAPCSYGFDAWFLTQEGKGQQIPPIYYVVEAHCYEGLVYILYEARDQTLLKPTNKLKLHSFAGDLKLPLSLDGDNLIIGNTEYPAGENYLVCNCYIEYYDRELDKIVKGKSIKVQDFNSTYDYTHSYPLAGLVRHGYFVLRGDDKVAIATQYKDSFAIVDRLDLEDYYTFKDYNYVDNEALILKEDGDKMLFIKYHVGYSDYEIVGIRSVDDLNFKTRMKFANTRNYTPTSYTIY